MLCPADSRNVFWDAIYGDRCKLHRILAAWCYLIQYMKKPKKIFIFYGDGTLAVLINL